jgi:hypothetical protein
MEDTIMATERETIDISNNPDLLRVVEEMRRRNVSAVLTNGNEDVAVVTPVANMPRRGGKRSHGRQKTEADVDAFLSAAGGWKDLVDTERLKRDIAESRARSSRSPIQLLVISLTAMLLPTTSKAFPKRFDGFPRLYGAVLPSVSSRTARSTTE